MNSIHLFSLCDICRWQVPSFINALLLSFGVDEPPAVTKQMAARLQLINSPGACVISYSSFCFFFCPSFGVFFGPIANHLLIVLLLTRNEFKVIFVVSSTKLK